MLVAVPTARRQKKESYLTNYQINLRLSQSICSSRLFATEKMRKSMTDFPFSFCFHAQVSEREFHDIATFIFRNVFDICRCFNNLSEKGSYLISLQINLRLPREHLLPSNKFSPSTEGEHMLFFARVYYPRAAASCQHKDRIESIRAGNKAISL